MTNHYDVIVAGAGSMGSATCYYLAKQGINVLGLEQFGDTPHENGSHAGQSRLIRKAYFEHPDYVPLLKKAYENIDHIEGLTGEQVYYRTGLLYYGPADHAVIRGVTDSASRFGIDLKVVTQNRVFKGIAGGESLFETNAGFLVPEKLITLYLKEAKNAGATILNNEKITGWEKKKGRFKVTTRSGIYYSNKLIITAGAWTSQLVKELNVPLKVTRQVLVWVQPDDPEIYSHKNFPCWVIAANDVAGVWYGFPYLNGQQFPGPSGMKFALHHPAGITDPDEVNRVITEEEIRTICNDAANYFIPAQFKVVEAKTCLYTNTSDEHFIIDYMPGYDKDVVIACGFSGHGFKFVPVIGELLADLALKGGTSLPAGFLGLSRFT